MIRAILYGAGLLLWELVLVPAKILWYVLQAWMFAILMVSGIVAAGLVYRTYFG